MKTKLKISRSAVAAHREGNGRAWPAPLLALMALALLGILPGLSQTMLQPKAAWDWTVSTPDKEGMDPKKLADLTEAIRKGEVCPRLHALLVVRHGRIALEEYFSGWQADRLHTLQSVTKSFASALVGIAIARGEFKGVEEKVLDFFPDMKDIANMDERKAAIRLKDLLTMRTGVDFHESGPNSPLEQLSQKATGWDKFYLDRPMISAPGTNFNYDSGGVILLSAMLKNRTGMHALEYAERYLFKPLGIVNKFWNTNLEGHTHTGGGLALTARDAARFGLLYLNNGRWGNEQIVPEAWVKESLSMQVDMTAPGQPPGGYGYWWWIGAPDWQGKGRQYVGYARGRLGQYIFVVPEYDMVVVFFGDHKTSAESGKIISVFYDRVLVAVRRPPKK